MKTSSNRRISNPVIDYTPKRKGEGGEKEVTLQFTPCIHCGKAIMEGYYGRFGNGGVCSKTCNTAQAQKPLDFGEPS